MAEDQFEAIPGLKSGDKVIVHSPYKYLSDRVGEVDWVSGNLIRLSCGACFNRHDAREQVPGQPGKYDTISLGTPEAIEKHEENMLKRRLMYSIENGAFERMSLDELKMLNDIITQ